GAPAATRRPAHQQGRRGDHQGAKISQPGEEPRRGDMSARGLDQQRRGAAKGPPRPTADARFRHPAPGGQGATGVGEGGAGEGGRLGGVQRLGRRGRTPTGKLKAYALVAFAAGSGAITTRLRPACLAWYIAPSARLRALSMLSPAPSGVMPALK